MVSSAKAPFLTICNDLIGRKVAERAKMAKAKSSSMNMDSLLPLCWLFITSTFYFLPCMCSLANCVSDCPSEVQVAYNDSDQTALCVLDDFDCLDDCGGGFNNSMLIDAHCECNSDALFTDFSYSFAGIPYCCNDFECRYILHT